MSLLSTKMSSDFSSEAEKTNFENRHFLSSFFSNEAYIAAQEFLDANNLPPMYLDEVSTVYAYVNVLYIYYVHMYVCMHVMMSPP